MTQLLIARERHGIACDAAWTTFQVTTMQHVALSLCYSIVSHRIVLHTTHLWREVPRVLRQADVGRVYLPLRNAVRALGSLDALQSLATVSASPGCPSSPPPPFFCTYESCTRTHTCGLLCPVSRLCGLVNGTCTHVWRVCGAALSSHNTRCLPPSAGL